MLLPESNSMSPDLNAKRVQHDKRALRREALARRKALPRAEKARHDRVIRDLVLGLEAVRGAGALLTYVSSLENETDTWAVLRAFLSQERPVFVPLTGERFGEMTFARILSPDELRPRRFGLLEPDPAARRADPVPENAVCLVPGLAFTRTGYRIGYGGGYFDRFLAAFKGVSVGLAYALQVVDTVPVLPHDTPVDLLVTEEGAVDCAAERGLRG